MVFAKNLKLAALKAHKITLATININSHLRKVNTVSTASKLNRATVSRA